MLHTDAILQGPSSQLDLNIHRAATFLVGVVAHGTLEKDLSSGNHHQIQEKCK